jgi:mRNA interferase YafQ
MMRTVNTTTRFNRDLRREASGVYGKRLDALVGEVVAMLAADQPLPPRYRDHAMTGPWRSYRDCHIRPDLVLVYREPNNHSLELVRLGSHSELGF